MRTLHIVLVCHTELDFDGSWALYEKAQPGMEEVLREVADATGEMPKMTYCLTSDFLSELLLQPVSTLNGQTAQFGLDLLVATHQRKAPVRLQWITTRTSGNELLERLDRLRPAFLQD